MPCYPSFTCTPFWIEPTSAITSKTTYRWLKCVSVSCPLVPTYTTCFFLCLSSSKSPWAWTNNVFENAFSIKLYGATPWVRKQITRESWARVISMGDSKENRDDFLTFSRELCKIQEILLRTKLFYFKVPAEWYHTVCCILVFASTSRAKWVDNFLHHNFCIQGVYQE